MTIRVTDTGTPAKDDFETITIEVGEVNVPPVLAPIGNKTINEGSQLSFTATATDADLPANTLTYSLAPGAPSGASIDPGSGVFSWTPTEAQGPNSYEVTIRVSDNGTPVLDDFETITIEVGEVNVAPVLAPIGNKTIKEGSQLSFTATATDADLPANSLTYSLDPGAPAGASVDPTSGVFSWTPTTEGTYGMTVRVTDNGVPPLADSETITVTVENVAPNVSVDTPTQSVQYSDSISTVTFTATDISTDLMNGSVSYSTDGGTTFTAGLPDAMSLEPNIGLGFSGDSNQVSTGAWTLSGVADLAVGSYVVRVAVGDGLDSGTADTEIVVEPEDALIRFHGSNKKSVMVDSPGSDSSEAFQLTVNTQELFPDAGVGVLAGDISLASVNVQLVPVGPGSTVTANSCSGEVHDVGYDARLTTTCDFDAVPVNTYTIAVTVDGSHYAGTSEDVVTVYDPSLGYTSGGGSFFWPDTADLNTGYLGDLTTFGYTMEYGKNGKKVKGSLLLIRHLADGSIYRLKSNALQGLSLGRESDFSWASFTGKGTYLAPGSDAEGNHEFVVYVEDRDDPEVDRIWLQTLDKNDDVIPDLSMSAEAVDNALAIEDGDIFAP